MVIVTIPFVLVLMICKLQGGFTREALVFGIFYDFVILQKITFFW